MRNTARVPLPESTTRIRMRRLFVTCCLLACASRASGQVFDEKMEHWPIDLKINGQIVVASELEDVSVLKELIRERQLDGEALLLFDADTKTERSDALRSLFGEKAKVGLLEAISTVKNSPGIVLIHTTGDLSDAERKAIVSAKDTLQRLIADGGTLVVVGSVAELVSERYFESDDIQPRTTEGLGLMPDCVLECGYDGSADQRRVLSVLAARPRCVGIGLDPQTAMVLSGRKMRVAGKGRATFMLMANDRDPVRLRSIRPMTSRRVADYEDVLLDLTQWRRDAIDRTLPVFPAKKPRAPIVENGTLLIVGGGGMPRGLMEQMVELAGGVEKAKMVYVPCSEADDVGERHGMVSAWKRMGIEHATFIHTKDRIKADTDEEFLAPLKDATGIFFGGGRQWNFADSYYGTKAHKLMKSVLKRGGVIAGSSAGASIQGRYLARATPIQNFKIMAFGYERGGLGFLDGVAIDQHFSQRGRQKDMTQLVNKYPQMLGIGIDETTAIIVQKSNAKVVGRGKVHFYDRNLPVYPDKPDFIALPAGSEYDLAERKVLKDTTKTEEAETESDE